MPGAHVDARCVHGPIATTTTSAGTVSPSTTTPVTSPVTSCVTTPSTLPSTTSVPAFAFAASKNASVSLFGWTCAMVSSVPMGLDATAPMSAH